MIGNEHIKTTFVPRTVIVTHRFSENLKRQTHSLFFFYATRGATRLFFMYHQVRVFWGSQRFTKGFQLIFILYRSRTGESPNRGAWCFTLIPNNRTRATQDHKQMESNNWDDRLVTSFVTHTTNTYKTTRHELNQTNQQTGLLHLPLNNFWRTSFGSWDHGSAVRWALNQSVVWGEEQPHSSCQMLFFTLLRLLPSPILPPMAAACRGATQAENLRCSKKVCSWKQNADMLKS